MFKSYTQGRNLFGTLTKNTSTANLTYGDETANDAYGKICALKDWPFLHRLRTATTVASTTFVNLPYDVDQVESVFVTVSSTRYNPKPAPSRKFWDELHYSTQTSDTPEYWYVYNGQLGLWPRPSTAGNTISINARVRVISLSIADITSATITTLANGSTALTVSVGLTVQMAGFWIRPTFSTTANTGDGQWYEIASVTSGTVGALVRNYGGLSIAAGTAACTISQMPLLPEDFHDLPWLYAAYTYWHKETDPRADDLKKRYNEGLASLITKWSSPINDYVIDDGSDKTLENPNLFITAT